MGGPPDGAAPFRAPLGVVRGFAGEDADVAVVDVGIDGADGGDEGHSFGQEFLARVGRGLAFVFDLDGQKGRQDVGEAHAPALVLRAGADVVLGDVLGILAVFLVVAESGLPREASPDLPGERGGRQAELPGQLPEGQAPARGEPEIAVVRHGDLFALLER